MKPEVYSKLVTKRFATKYVNSAVGHFQGMVAFDLLDRTKIKTKQKKRDQ